MSDSLEQFVCFLRENKESYSVMDAATVSAVYETWSSLTGTLIEGWNSESLAAVVELFDEQGVEDEFEDLDSEETVPVKLSEPSVKPFKSRSELSGVNAFPLRGWRFNGELRQYQADILQKIEEPGQPKEGNLYRSLHIVAPPGSGKTVLGLTLAARSGKRALVLSPTLVIKDQWVRQSEAFVGASPSISSDSEASADVNVFTYQMLAVMSTENPFLQAGLELWADELVESEAYSRETAEEWLSQLESQNRDVYRRGVRYRAAKVRRESKTLQDVSLMERVLHSNAVSLANRLADAGVETVILDECHHLLDHWALVVHYLLQIIKDRGGDPLLIGLTATYPSFDGDKSYENYTSLLGGVDYEIPTPAVVKAGSLAPYVNFAWFCEPTEQERKFIKNHSKEVGRLVSEVFESEGGYLWLMRQFIPTFPDVDAGRVPEIVGNAYSDVKTDKGLYHLDRVSSMLAEMPRRVVESVDGSHVYAEVMKVSPRLSNLNVVDKLLLLSFYALDEVLPDSSRKPLWDKIRSMLSDYGYYLTDKGVRQGRNPGESVLANSLSKDAAAVRILQLEEGANPAGKVKAVIVTDFAVHGNRKGRSSSVPAGGALRTYYSLCGDSQVRNMNPVLVTSKHFRVLEEQVEALTAAVEKALSLPSGSLTWVQVEGMPGIVEVSLESVGSGASVLKALRGLVKDGVVRVIVGTRGLLGEGWDNPHVNTLIDLTTTATSSSVQQLRGRTLRLDPNWERKVAHNWSVACVMKIDENPAGDSEIRRLERKHSHSYSLTADVNNSTIVKGLPNVLVRKQLVRLEKYITESYTAVSRNSVDVVNGETVERFLPRDESYDRWDIGGSYRNTEESVNVVSSKRAYRSFFGGFTLSAAVTALLIYLGISAAHASSTITRARAWDSGLAIFLLFAAVLIIFGWSILPPIYKMFRSLAKPLTYYRGACEALIVSLQNLKLLSSDVSVSNLHLSDDEGEVRVSLVNVTTEESKVFDDCLAEMFSGDASLNPRFLIEVGGKGLLGPTEDKKLRKANKPSLSVKILSLLNRSPHYVPVPSVIARRKDNAISFLQLWRKHVPYMMIREVRNVSDRKYIALYRRQVSKRGTYFIRKAVLREWR